ncbi:MAG: amidase [Gemmataceae bacterium]|nr:amidase [Gemmataceae bacterium]
MSPEPSRRQLLAAAAAVGIGPPTFHRALAAQAAAAQPAGAVTPEMVEQAEWVAGVKLTEAQRKSVAGSLTGTLRQISAIHKVEIGNHVPPAVHFLPDPGQPGGNAAPKRPAPVEPPVDVFGPPVVVDDDLAFQSVSQLAALIRTRKVSAVELTKLYLDRLKRYDPALKCVVTLTEELALKQAAQADREIAAKQYRGPLHGIPWGAKDLIAYPGYRTTWGAELYKDRVIDAKATVAARLDDAGAVLAAKTTLGTLALGDVWFGGTTRNPWDVRQGSSGSSAGSASGVAAGLVGFALGSETNGSIISPCTRCGATGLRPTFGRVSRHGCMALSWSMDKIGPIARSVEDCALVFAAVHGADGQDPTATTRPFEWPYPKPLKEVRVGYVDGKNEAELKVLKDLGVKLVPIALPSRLPAQAMHLILSVEASAAFDDLTRAGDVDKIGPFWPRTFQTHRFVPAVEYLRAMRARTLLMQDMAKLFEAVDLYVGVFDLFITNLTGHPCVVLPNGFAKANGAEVPTALTFTGKLFGEAELLHVAKAYQEATGFHLKHPDMAKVTKENAEKK